MVRSGLGPLHSHVMLGLRSQAAATKATQVRSVPCKTTGTQAWASSEARAGRQDDAGLSLFGGEGWTTGRRRPEPLRRRGLDDKKMAAGLSLFGGEG